MRRSPFYKYLGFLSLVVFFFSIGFTSVSARDSFVAALNFGSPVVAPSPTPVVFPVSPVIVVPTPVPAPTSIPDLRVPPVSPTPTPGITPAPSPVIVVPTPTPAPCVPTSTRSCDGSVSKPMPGNVNAPCGGRSFRDLDPTSLEGKAACELSRRGIIEGYVDGTFRGGDSVNRVSVLKVLMLACRPNEVDAKAGSQVPSIFKDVSSGQWFFNIVQQAVSNKIVSGFPDKTFRPGGFVNKAEYVKMLALSCNIQVEPGVVTFKDVRSTDYFRKYLPALAKYNLFPGETSKTVFDGKRHLTRKEIAISLYQLFQQMDGSVLKEKSDIGDLNPPSN